MIWRFFFLRWCRLRPVTAAVTPGLSHCCLNLLRDLTKLKSYKVGSNKITMLQSFSAFFTGNLHASWERQIPVASSLLIYLFPLRPARPSGPTGPPAAHYEVTSWSATVRSYKLPVYGPNLNRASARGFTFLHKFNVLTIENYKPELNQLPEGPLWYLNLR
jgi:hypothetical protein